MKTLKLLGLTIISTLALWFLFFGSQVGVLPVHAQPQNLLRLAGTQALDSDLTKTCEYFARLVQEKTKGQVKIEVYPAGQLFSDKDMPRALPSGAVDIAQVTSGIWTGLVPALGIVEVPFFFKDSEHIDRVIDSPGFRKLIDPEFEKQGIKLLFRLDWGGSHLIASKMALRRLEDFKGKRLRVHGDVPAEISRALGASPVFMGTGEVYLGLQRGTVDGVFTTPCLAWDKKYWEVIKFATHLKPGDLMSLPLMLMNLQKWNEMPPDIQKILNEAGQEAKTWGIKLAFKRTEECSTALTGKKVEIFDISEKEKQRWGEACRPILARYIQHTGEVGKKIVEEINRVR